MKYSKSFEPMAGKQQTARQQQQQTAAAAAAEDMQWGKYTIHTLNIGMDTTGKK